MVQRKVPHKLGIHQQADHLHLHHHHHTRSVNIKQMLSLEAPKSSRGTTDLKKMMMKKKKSGKSKLSELGRNSSSSTPNYMKSTSSADARTEKSQVSSRSPSSSKCKNSTRILKSGGHNPSRTGLTSSKTTTSLKLVRALTKAPSFKPVRVSPSKKCPQVVLCESGLDVQRATCSSTLKDSKFPCYLELNPGEITSAMKVCPYTYCSLNGHHHLRLPPLKSFLSARRLSVKANRNLRKGCSSSPCPARPPGVGDVPDRQQEKLEFTIEIYCKEGAEMEKICNLDSSPQTGPAEPTTHFFDGAREEVEEKGDLSSVIEYSSAGESDMDWEGIVESINHNEEPDLESYCLDEKVCEVTKEPTSLLKAEDKASCSSDDFVAEKMEQESFDEESVTSEAGFLSDDDTNSSISCLGSDFKGCDNQPATHNEDEKETAQTRLLASDELTDEEICKDFSVPYEEKVILQEDDVMTTPMQELHHQDSEDSHRNNAVPNNGFTTISGSEEATQDEPTETSEDRIQKPPENVSDQHIYNVEDESSSPIKTHKTSQVPEEQNADIEVLPSLRRTSRGHNRLLIEEDEPRGFNPRGPNFLPPKPVPEAERVDLKHQMMDERKNSEEWMIDYALQQAVNKLGPVRRKKVSLLVEAFETVSPIPKCEPRMRQSTNLFPPNRFIQACN